jgi:hypothetical protein
MLTKMSLPSPTEPNGARDPGTGRFLAGNRLARGNPYAKRVGQLRSKLLRLIRPAELEAVVNALLEKTRKGDGAAARKNNQKHAQHTDTAHGR